MAFKPRMAIAGAALVGALAGGGISLASAHAASTLSTTSTTNPSSSSTPHDRANCPHMGNGNGRGAGYGNGYGNGGAPGGGASYLPNGGGPTV